MTIMYPLDLPVTAAEIQAKLQELLARTEEWNEWERTVLTMVSDNVASVHRHYVAHVWHEGGIAFDQVAARDDVLHAVNVLASAITQQHAALAPLDVHVDNEIFVLDAGEKLSGLMLEAATLVDDLMVSLRRGPCAITTGTAYGIAMTEWEDSLEFTSPDARSPEIEHAMATIEATPSTRTDAIIKEDTAEVRRECQGERNRERLQKAIDSINDDLSIPKAYRLAWRETNGNVMHIVWGETERGRPGGTEKVEIETNSLHELHPRTISEIARLARSIVLTLGRDVEISENLLEDGQAPGWTRAGPLPILLHMRSLQGDQAGLPDTTWVPGEQPVVTIKNLDLGGATYTYDAETLDEIVIVRGTVSADLQHNCIGNPASVIMTGALFQDDRITIESCIQTPDGTVLTLTSPIVRMAIPPRGVEENPIVAWEAALKNFDAAAVYGETRTAS